jgi:hypothetical protein
MVRDRIMLPAQRGVQHRTLQAATPGHSEQVRKTEVFAGHSPFAIQAGLLGCNQVATTLHKDT